MVAAAIAAAAFVLSWILPQKTLRETVVAGNGIGESFAIPKDTASLAEAARALSQLLGRDERRKLVERLAERAGVDLSAAACWLIVRLRENPAADIPALCRTSTSRCEVGEQALQELIGAGDVDRRRGLGRRARVPRHHRRARMSSSASSPSGRRASRGAAKGGHPSTTPSSTSC